MVTDRNTRYFNVLFLGVLFLFFIPADSLAKSVVLHQAGAVESKDNKYVTLRIERDISLDELITSEGYDIDDENITLFLEDFSRRNEQIRSLSTLRRGSVVTLPLAHLKKTKTYFDPLREKPETIKKKRKAPGASQIVREKTETAVTKKKKPRMLNRKIVLRNIRMLADFLEDRVALKAEGFKIFQINEKSKRILVVDYLGILPGEVRNMVELAWPEYRIVSNAGSDDLKHIIGSVLDALGYSVSRNKRILVGGKTRIDYYSDFLVHPQDKDILEDDLFIISVIESGKFASPPPLVNLLNNKGIRLLELSYDGDGNEYRANADYVHIGHEQNIRSFTESVLSLLGYRFTKDTVITISNRKEFQYRLTADLSVASGRRKKIIEFFELSPYELGYAKKMGFDIATIQLRDDRKTIIKKLIHLFSLNHRSSPRANSLSVTPRDVKYRLVPDGFFVNSMKGPVFLMDSEFRPDVMRQIVNDKNTYITF
jgi:hypothetical protein